MPWQQAERLDLAVFGQAQHKAAFRIGQIDEQSLGAELLDIAGEIEDQRHRAQREEQGRPARRSRPGVADAVFAGNREVMLPQPITIDGDRIDDKVGAL